MQFQFFAQLPQIRLQSSKQNDEVIGEDVEQKDMITDIMSETQCQTEYLNETNTESQDSYDSDNDNNEDNQFDDRDNIIQQTSKLYAPTVFPSQEELVYPIYQTHAIPEDYQFKNKQEYTRIMNTLEREKFLKPVRQAIEKQIFNKQSSNESQEQDIQTREIEVFKSYQVTNTTFCNKLGILITVQTTRMVQQSQSNKQEIKGNQLIIFFNKITNEMHLGKTIQPKRTQNDQNENQFADDGLDDDNDADLEETDLENVDSFQRVPIEQNFQIQIDITDNIAELLINIKDIESNYWLISSSDYWYASEISLKCIQRFNKGQDGLAFPTETIQGKYEAQFPQYSFLSTQENIDEYKNNLKNYIQQESPKFDATQLNAFEYALSNQNSIIQGPPGTGKTFLGCEIVNALLKNYSPLAKKPILVLSKKNKSLDNLLVKLIQVMDMNEDCQVLRLGSRITDQKIEQFSVRNQNGPHKFLFKSRHDWFDIDDGFMSLFDRLDGYCDMNEPISQSIYDVLKLNLMIVLCDNLNIEMTREQRQDIQYCIADSWMEESNFNTYQIVNILTNVGIVLNSQQQQQLNDLIQQQQQPWQQQIIMREEDLINQIRRITSFGDFNTHLREIIFNSRTDYFANKLSSKLQTFKKDLLKRYEICDNIVSNKMNEFMSQFQIIGMTFSGFHMNYQALAKLQPEIILVEEASEILETEFFPILSPWVKHLIQIGDHQQLRPVVKSTILQRHFNLEKSYFERLVSINKAKCITLMTQRRMRPEFSKITQLFYGKGYTDHDCVKNFKSIDTISKSSMYMLSHTFPEKDVGTKTYINIFEAHYAIELGRDLVFNQNYSPKQITIICMYSAQYQYIQMLIQNDYILRNIQVSTVDKYQGQENDIIILSCVRSNTTNTIGFLGIDNRINVAFSRARKGFICLGNFLMYEQTSNRWKEINQKVLQISSFGGKQKKHYYKEILRKVFYRNFFLTCQQCNNCNEKSHLGKCKQ